MLNEVTISTVIEHLSEGEIDRFNQEEIKTRIKNMPNSMAKMCLLEEYKKREEELMNISNSDCLFGELNIEDLLA